MKLFEDCFEIDTYLPSLDKIYFCFGNVDIVFYWLNWAIYFFRVLL